MRRICMCAELAPPARAAMGGLVAKCFDAPGRDYPGASTNVHTKKSGRI